MTSVFLVQFEMGLQQSSSCLSNSELLRECLNTLWLLRHPCVVHLSINVAEFEDAVQFISDGHELILSFSKLIRLIVLQHMYSCLQDPAILHIHRRQSVPRRQIRRWCEGLAIS